MSLFEARHECEEEEDRIEEGRGRGRQGGRNLLPHINQGGMFEFRMFLRRCSPQPLVSDARLTRNYVCSFNFGLRRRRIG